MKCFLLSILFIVSFKAWSEVPSFLITERAVVEEFRGSLRSKIEELSQNYIKTQTEQAIVWFSTETVECNGKKYPAKFPLASITMSRSTNIFQFELKGCAQEVALSELFITKSSSDFTLTKYLQGEWPEGLNRYLLKDGHDKNIFELRKNKDLSSFKFLEQKFLDIYKEENRWQYFVQGYAANYENEGFSFGVSLKFDDFRVTIDWDENSYRILDNEYRRIGLNSFLIGYSHAIQTATLTYVGNILKSLLNELPSTEFVSTGGQNSRFLDEMRLTYTRLLNNLELNLVRQFVQDVIKAIESGFLKITDNRPEAS